MKANMAQLGLFIVVLQIRNPYVRKGDDRLAQLSAVELLAMCMLGQVLAETVEGELEPWIDTALSIGLIVLVLCAVGTFFMMSFRNARKMYRNKQRKSKAVTNTFDMLQRVDTAQQLFSSGSPRSHFNVDDHHDDGDEDSVKSTRASTSFFSPVFKRTHSGLTSGSNVPRGRVPTLTTIQSRKSQTVSHQSLAGTPSGRRFGPFVSPGSHSPAINGNETIYNNPLISEEQPTSDSDSKGVVRLSL